MNQVKHCFFYRKLMFDTKEKMIECTITLLSEETVLVLQTKRKGAKNNEQEVSWIHTITSS